MFKQAKNVLMILFAITLLLFMYPDESSAAITNYNATGKVVTNSTDLNVRQSTSTTAKVIGTVKKGSEVTITGKTTGWYRIKFGSTVGYVSANYIEIKKVTEKLQVLNLVGTVKTASTALNVRKEANDTSTVLTTVAKGSSVTITGKIGSWYQVKVKNIVGYVASEYISINTQTPTPTPAPVTPVETVEDFSANGVVTTESTSLNVRAQPNDSSKVITTAAKNSTVKITGKTKDWYRISINGQTGFVAKKYVTLKVDVVIEEPEIKDEKLSSYIAKGTVKQADYKYINANPNSAFAGKFNASSTVTITKQSANFYLVNDGYFIVKSFVDLHPTFKSVNYKGIMKNQTASYVQPSTYAPKGSSLAKQKVVEVTGESDSLYRIKHQSKTIYVLKSAVTLSEAITKVSKAYYVFNASKEIAPYDSPSSKGNKLTKLSKLTALKVVGTTKSYYEVEHNSKKMYVLKKDVIKVVGKSGVSGNVVHMNNFEVAYFIDDWNKQLKIQKNMNKAAQKVKLPGYLKPIWSGGWQLATQAVKAPAKTYLNKIKKVNKQKGVVITTKLGLFTTVKSQ